MADMSENATDPAPPPEASAGPSPTPPPALPARPPGAPGPPGAPVPGFRWYPTLTRVTDRSVLGGVCAGLAAHLGVNVTHVRLAMALLASISGAGVLFYAVLWVLTPSAPAREVPSSPESAERRRGLALLVVGVAGAVLSVMVATATALHVLVPVLVVAVGAMLVWQQYDRGGRIAPRSSFDWARVTAGVTLVVVGLAVVVLGQVELAALQSSILAVAATLVGVGLLSVPLGMRLWRSLEEERAARIREAERSTIASHLHDSVLQTLALIQKRSDDPAQVSRLARRQERELRQWLFGSESRMSSGAATVAGTVEVIVGDVEDAYGLRVDQVVVGGDGPVGESEEAVLGAVREALVNVAKHAGVESADVYAEILLGELSVFVRDRGRGFDPDNVPEGHHGLAESVRGRVERAGGRVRIRSAPGEGTEVSITMDL